MPANKLLYRMPFPPEQINSQQIISPETYDELVAVVNLHDLFPIISFGSLILLVLAWSFFGEIPIKVSGRAVLSYPNKVIDVESSITGKIEQIKVNPGNCVKKNQVLAVMESSDIKQRLEQEKFKLNYLYTQHQQATFLENERIEIENKLVKQQQTSKQQSIKNNEDIIPISNAAELEAIRQQKTSIFQKMRNIQKITPELKEKQLQEIFKQRISLIDQIQNARHLKPILENRLKQRKLLFTQGAISQDQVIQSEQDYLQNSQQISQLEAQLQGLDVKKPEIEQRYKENLSTISNYQTELKQLESKSIDVRRKFKDSLTNIEQTKAELKELEIRQRNLVRENLQSINNRQNEIQQTKNNIDNLTKEYNANKELKSATGGCFLEIIAMPGAILQKGQRFGSMEIKGNHDEIVTVSYFSIGDGKQIKPGMKVQVTPDTVSRERFGGIVGTVTEVSSFPITKSGASNLVGNPEIIEYLTQGTSQNTALIQVKANLTTDPSTFSGYQWSSSKGPELKVTAGTTATVQAIVEKRRPITFVLPILREWSGID
ncbi:NHLP bacteriocin system secretion protein [Scytonema sp. UIC 10036]|uniref:NHLP bacteriocin system secretion protein n=1 Tax=Scytonema sp. UIC 10036 TaxID=2304196 RepID=UPI0012DA9A30|nr:NHLP bacteriocin system secretion protein [Scytonema sp. UIC 10036]MUH01780.1 NHLP bacteriocin system secretion protein [Scytonema sp. UIC 10036]